jgi:phosphohistidine swiveling domain-containing protein
LSNDLYTTPLTTQDDSLEVVGGKGRSLAKMANAGFHVPGGFLVVAAAYRSFVTDNNLQQQILDLAKPAVVEGRASFEQSSTNVQKLFADIDLSEHITSEIRQAYESLDGQPAVAVRSSANAEDLPGLSFAGQQETYLNVTGADAVVAAVKNCWSSLWTAQAISYRHQNGIDQNSVAMAVVVQIMVPSEVSGILFTANPATGERNEIIINASFGLGEAVVSGQVTPDTYIIDKANRTVKETMIGPKEQKIVSDGAQGVRMEDVTAGERDQSSLSDEMLAELIDTVLRIEQLYGGLPQDIEWAFSGGKLHLLQSRPITNLPVQPIEVEWIPTPPAKTLVRRQIVENMPDPVCPLFEQLYLTEGLEMPRKDRSVMVGGGPLFVTMNGFAYQRADWPQLQPKKAKESKEVTDADLEEQENTIAKLAASLNTPDDKVAQQEAHDMELMVADLTPEDQKSFRKFEASQNIDDLAHQVTMPKSETSVYMFASKTDFNDRQLGEWHDETMPRLKGVGEKWAQLDLATATDEELLAGIREMGNEEGNYWSSNASHTFGVAKSTDSHLQDFLAYHLPDHNYISGQFLSGIESKTMQANADLFEIAKLIRADEDLSYLVTVTPAQFLMQALRERARDHAGTAAVVEGIDRYLNAYGHQGYSMDFVEPTQIEDPSALFATIKAMVQDEDYDPKNQENKAKAIREQKFAEVSELLSGVEYWQFRYRWWLARKYNYIREEVAFYFGYTWKVLRPMAAELGRRMVDAGTFLVPEDTYFLVTDELDQAIAARKSGKALPELGKLAAERRELREARKRHHPPGTVPEEASNVPGIKFKETQIKNDDSSDTMNGFAVSSGRVTAPASVITGPAEFDKMAPGSILVSPLTTPAWTQLFAHAVGLVTDMGSILAHGSIVAREYGIPAVLGVGNGTKRIEHGQMITIDGDAGTVVIHDSVEEAS